jgi:hypothetical protein
LEQLELNLFIAEVMDAKAGLHRRPAMILILFFGTMKKIGGLLPELFKL